MTPLLDLYLYLNDKIPFSDYEMALNDFDRLWGTNLHIFTDNVLDTKHLKALLEYLSNSQLMSYSFLDGTETGIFNGLTDEFLLELERKKVNAVAVPINKNLIKDDRYKSFFSYKGALKLETYLKVSKENIKDIDMLVKFMLDSNIKLCIVDVEKSPQNNKKLSPEEYKKCISYFRNNDIKEKIRFSIIECPYPREVKGDIPKIFGGCCGGISSCMIDAEGNILPCHYLPSFSQGNIIKDRLYDVWQNSKLFAHLRDRKHTVKGICQNCKFLFSCGGCRAESFYKNKSLFLDDPYCFIDVTERI